MEQEQEPSTVQDHHGTNEEVEMAVYKLKKNKAPGTDNIPAELFKYGGNEIVKHLHTIIKEIWVMKKMPTDWNLSIICPIHKKGDPMECSNYRGVSLLNTAYKILSTILFTRISPFAENIIGNYQCGFWNSRSTVNQLFTLRQILEKTSLVLKHTIYLLISSLHMTQLRENSYTVQWVNLIYQIN